MCPDGLVASGDGGCIPASDCPCVHNEASYQPGQTIRMGCNTWYQGGVLRQWEGARPRQPRGGQLGPRAGRCGLTGTLPQHLSQPDVAVHRPALPGHLRGVRGRPLPHLRRAGLQLQRGLRVHAAPGTRPLCAPARPEARSRPSARSPQRAAPLPTGPLRRERQRPGKLPRCHRERSLWHHRDHLLQGYQDLPGGEQGRGSGQGTPREATLP